MPEHSVSVPLFHILIRAHDHAILNLMAEQGLLDVGQPLILCLLRSCENGELPAQKDLAQHLHVSPSTIANSLKSLERMGYIKKLPDEADGRKKRVSITEKGKDAERRCLLVLQKIDGCLYDGFSPQELEQITQLHTRMLENLNRLNGGKHPCCPHPRPFPPHSRKDETPC